jgi:metal-responsive CopG/Arc/MetJ family transcriptional regulator
MESSEQLEREEMVRLTIELSASTVAWLDDLRLQMGFRSRGVIIEQLLRELGPEPEPGDEAAA